MNVYLGGYFSLDLADLRSRRKLNTELTEDTETGAENIRAFVADLFRKPTRYHGWF